MNNLTIDKAELLSEFVYDAGKMAHMVKDLLDNKLTEPDKAKLRFTAWGLVNGPDPVCEEARLIADNIANHKHDQQQHCNNTIAQVANVLTSDKLKNYLSLNKNSVFYNHLATNPVAMYLYHQLGAQALVNTHYCEIDSDYGGVEVPMPQWVQQYLQQLSTCTIVTAADALKILKGDTP